MMWPAGYGTTNPPRLGGDAGQKAAYMAYIAAFNDAAFDTFPLFYHPEVTLELPNGKEITGRDKVVDFYKPMFETIKETFEVKRLIADDEGICAGLLATFAALKDAPEFTVKPLKKGESVTVDLIVMYELKDGLIYTIRGTRKQ
jgi:hypothetical protein